MTLIGKFLSALRLLARGDVATFQRQWQRHRRQSRLQHAPSTIFRHETLGFPVACHPSWPESAGQFLEGHSDAWEFRLLQTWLEPGEHFLDLGANTGLYAFAALPAVGPTGLVVAVDAAPEVIRQNQAGARLLGANNLHFVQAAVTGRSGTITFYVRPDGLLTTEQSLRPAAAQRAGSVPITVPARTLADLAAAHQLGPKLTAVKIDIEGAEAEALHAAPPGWFTADGPLWIVEINPEALTRFGTTAVEILACFPAATFECWLLPKHPHDPKVHPALRAARPQDRLDDSLYYNLFAVPRGSRWQPRTARLAGFFPDSALLRPA